MGRVNKLWVERTAKLAASYHVRNVLETGSQMKNGLTFIALGGGIAVWCKKVLRSLGG